MLLAKWENSRNGEVRIYVNSLIKYKEGALIPKFWLENIDGVAVFRQKKTKNSCIEEEDARVLFRKTLVEDGYIESEDELVTWEMALEFVEESAKKKKKSYRESRSEGKTKGYSKQKTLAAQKAFQLDLTSIEFDNPQTVIIDHREPMLLQDLLRDHPMINVKVESLDIGDIHILREDGARIVIERKDCDKDIGQRTDFEASVIDSDKRLFNQSERMKFEPETIPVFLLEGDVHNNAQSMLVQAIDGAISYLLTLQTMNVVTTLNLPHTAYVIAKYAKHFTEGLGYELALRPKKPEALLDSKAFVLEGIPGVSGSLARILLKHFGSVKNVSNASLDELVLVPGVGPKKALQIFQSLG